MLRVTVREDGRLCRLELAGRLAGPWVAETERAWLSSSCSDRQIEIDMTQVTWVDDAGRKLLSAMHRAGARLVAEGVAMTALIAEVTGTAALNSTKPKEGERGSPAKQDSRIKRGSN